MAISGQAVLIYGEPRLTKDIDIALGIGTDGIEKVTGLVSQLGLKVLVEDIDDFVKKTMILPVYDSHYIQNWLREFDRSLN